MEQDSSDARYPDPGDVANPRPGLVRVIADRPCNGNAVLPAVRGLSPTMEVSARRMRLLPGHGFQPTLHRQELGMRLGFEGLVGQHRVARLDQVEGGCDSASSERMFEYYRHPLTGIDVIHRRNQSDASEFGYSVSAVISSAMLRRARSSHRSRPAAVWKSGPSRSDERTCARAGLNTSSGTSAYS